MGGGSVGGTKCVGGLTKNVMCRLAYDLNFATQLTLAIRNAEEPYAKLYLMF